MAAVPAVASDLPSFGSFGARESVPTIDELPPDRRGLQQRMMEQRGGVRGRPTTAAGWKDDALTCVDREQYGPAAEAFRHAAEIYAAKGDPNAAKVLEIQAERYETRVSLFYSRPVKGAGVTAAAAAAATLSLRRRYYTGRRLEPLYGCYIGAFIDHEDGLSERFTGENGEEYRACAEFDHKTGKRHALFFTYNSYSAGRPFPQTWFDHLKQSGAAAQWVVQPGSLSDVQDDEYLRGLARQVRAAGIPVFVRFAGEMNGGWTPYHGDPERYKAAFRLVAHVFHETAPNAAMVWCPNDVPEHEIDSYYPGEEAVDWVGVNFYAVYYNNNDANRPVWWRNPADSLEYVYTKYAARHPIMIGECGATHMAEADGKLRDDYAVDKIGQLYAALPRRYPRVKAINWFSMNAIKYAPPGRRLNDYALLTEPKVTEQYRRMIASPYFLDRVSGGGTGTLDGASQEIARLSSGATLSGRVALSAYVKTYEQRPAVAFTANNRSLGTSFTIPGDYSFTLDTTTLPDGPARIAVEARDNKGRVAGRDTVTVTIRNGDASHDGSSGNGSGSFTKPRPTPAPAPVPVVQKTKPIPPTPPPPPAPVAMRLTLAQVVRDAATDQASLRLEVLQPGLTEGMLAPTRFPVGSKLRFRLRSDANGGAKGGYLFLLLIDRETGGAVHVLRAATESTGAGDTVEVPANPRRALKPDVPGRYLVLALLVPSPTAAAALSRTLPSPSGVSVTMDELVARWRAVPLPPGTKAWQARQELEILR